MTIFHVLKYPLDTTPDWSDVDRNTFLTMPDGVRDIYNKTLRRLADKYKLHDAVPNYRKILSDALLEYDGDEV